MSWLPLHRTCTSQTRSACWQEYGEAPPEPTAILLQDLKKPTRVPGLWGPGLSNHKSCTRQTPLKAVAPCPAQALSALKPLGLPPAGPAQAGCKPS